MRLTCAGSFTLVVLVTLGPNDGAQFQDGFSDGQTGDITHGHGLSMTAVRSAVKKVLQTSRALDRVTNSSSGDQSNWRQQPEASTNSVADFTDEFQVGNSCDDIRIKQKASKSGLYLIHPPNVVQGPWKVFCDQESDGGGWTVFQVRDDVEPHENFMRNWEDYKVGFGDFDREFWLGNVLLWALTNSADATKYELVIDLEDWSGNKRYARYRGFRVGPESDLYRLYFTSLHSANAGDSLFSHNGLPFSTFDKDNDDRDGAEFLERSCARLYKGGWWYGNCHDSNLNGWYLGGPHRSFADGINWYSWTGYNYSLRRTRMRLRPLPPSEHEGYKFRDPEMDSYLAAHKNGRKHDLHGTDIAALLSDINVLTKP